MSQTALPQPVFVPKAKITSDEVVVYHNKVNMVDQVAVGGKEKARHVNAWAAGPLLRFLEPQGHAVYPRANMESHLEAFHRKLDEPTLAVQLQNAVASSGFCRHMPEDADFQAVHAKMVARFRDIAAVAPDSPLFALPASKEEAGKRMNGMLDYLGGHKAFVSAEGSKVFQRALQDVLREENKAAHERGGDFLSTYAMRTKAVLQNYRWLPCSDGVHTRQYKPQRLADFARVQSQEGYDYVQVDAAKLQGASALLHEAATMHMKNVLSRLISVRKHARIPKDEFVAPAMSDEQAQGLMGDVLKALGPKSLGGKMVLQALSNPKLSVYMVERSRLTDYVHNFDWDIIKKKPAEVGGFSEHHPQVYIGCKDRNYMVRAAVEELVHHAFGLLYRNEQKTYARNEHSADFMSLRELGTDREMKAQEEAFRDALGENIAQVARADTGPGAYSEKRLRAEKQLCKDLDMPRSLYPVASLDAEVIAKIISMEAVGTWDSKLNQRWDKLVAFTHSKVEKDVDAWIAQGRIDDGAGAHKVKGDEGWRGMARPGMWWQGR